MGLREDSLLVYPSVKPITWGSLAGVGDVG